MVKQKKMPDGYKMSEVGVIPCEWEVKTFGELFDIYGGYSASRDQLSDKGYCYLHYGDIHKSNKTFIDVKDEFRILPKLNIPIKKISKNSLLKDGDVVFVDASEDDEGTSKHIVIRNSENIEYISGLHTIVARSKDEILLNLYKQFCFKTDDIKKQFKFYAAGTKVSGISKGNISKIYLPIPLKKEQKSIATALSDMDDLILSMKKLIDKKKLIKQGAMQELLSGKKRLDGFEGEWYTTSLGNLCEIKDGTHQTPNYVKYGIPFYSVENITNNDFINTKFISKEEHRYLTKNHKIEKGDILMTRIGSVGQCKYIDWDVDASFYVSLALLKVKNGISAQFLSIYSNCEFFKKQVELNSLQYAIPQKINLGKISDVLVKIPNSLEEQKAIAKILSDMDQEIEKLEIKLDKYKQIKKGMMEELLTGKRRLI